ncbi:MAG TPA: DoxX family protein [Ramlibacter sp.]|jgi:putative oxidoreductase
MYRSSTTDSTGDVLALVGRILIAYLFMPSGWGKLMGFSGVVGYIAKANVPLPEVCAAIAIAVELGLALLLLVGWQARWAALGMAIFTIVISPIFHAYWSSPEAAVAMQKLNFDKNMAIAGGLLALAAFGAGRLSIDGRRSQGVGRMQTA